MAQRLVCLGMWALKQVCSAEAQHSTQGILARGGGAGVVLHGLT